MAPKRAGKKAEPAKKKNKREDFEDGNPDDFFLGSDDEGRKGQESEEEEEQVETAEEKRLRLGKKEYGRNI